MEATDRFAAARLHAIGRSLFMAAGTPRHIADAVAEHLVNANLAGHDSHGVLRIPAYLRSIEGGGILPAAEPEVVQEAGVTLRIDGGRGFGHYAAGLGMQWAIERARQREVCGVTLVRTGHIGRLGTYAAMAAGAGCIGLITVGGGSRDSGGILPFGGARGRLGTNPEVPATITRQLQEWAEKLGVGIGEDAVEPADAERYRERFQREGGGGELAG